MAIFINASFREEDPVALAAHPQLARVEGRAAGRGEDDQAGRPVTT
jgi:hypothetical protein